MAACRTIRRRRSVRGNRLTFRSGTVWPKNSAIDTTSKFRRTWTIFGPTRISSWRRFRSRRPAGRSGEGRSGLSALSRANRRAFFGGLTEAQPVLFRKQSQRDQEYLAGHENVVKPAKAGIHETVGVEADAEHVDAEPGEAGDDIAEDGHIHDAAFADHAAPARVQDHGIPDHDEQRAVFLGIPAPETPPRLVSPDAAQHGADKAEEGGKADNAVDHSPKRPGGGFIQSAGEHPAHDINDGEETGDEG